jgi:hypothetical protein
VKSLMSEILHQLKVLLGVGTYHSYPAQGQIKKENVSSSMSALSWELGYQQFRASNMLWLEKIKQNYIKREKQRN